MLAEGECDIIVLVPTSGSNRLLPSNRVFINDAPWHLQGAVRHELLHNEVSPRNGQLLGCRSVREELAKDCEQTLFTERVSSGEFGQSFSQTEQLYSRIENLLQKYDDEKDVFVEQYAAIGARTLSLSHSCQPC